MYGVICSPKFWPEINDVIALKGEQALYKTVDVDIDILAEIEKVSRIAIRYLIIDISAAEDQKTLLKAIKTYRILSDRTQIIVIAPNCSRGSDLLHKLVLMGIYDIIAVPENVEEFDIQPVLKDVLETPLTYKKAVKWLLDSDFTENSQDDVLEKGKNKTKEIMKNEPIVRRGLKDTIMSWGWDGTGKSFFLSNLAVLLAKNGAKVALIEGNLINKELITFFKIEKNQDGLMSLLSQNKSALEYAITPIKNLYVYTLPPYADLDSSLFDLSVIQDKLHDKVDFILVDNGAGLNDTFLNNVKYATKVYMVITPNIAKLISLSQIIGSMFNRGINLNKFEAVLNQYSPTREIDTESINTILNQFGSQANIFSDSSINIAATIPPLYPMAFESHAIGKPLAMGFKEDLIEKSLDPLVSSLWLKKSSPKGLMSFLKR